MKCRGNSGSGLSAKQVGNDLKGHFVLKLGSINSEAKIHGTFKTELFYQANHLHSFQKHILPAANCSFQEQI